MGAFSVDLFGFSVRFSGVRGNELLDIVNIGGLLCFGISCKCAYCTWNVAVELFVESCQSMIV